MLRTSSLGVESIRSLWFVADEEVGAASSAWSLAKVEAPDFNETVLDYLASRMSFQCTVG